MRKPDVERTYNFDPKCVVRFFIFDNGYGVSAVRGLSIVDDSLWEVAMHSRNPDGSYQIIGLRQDEDCVLKNLTDEEVEAEMKRIEALPPR